VRRASPDRWYDRLERRSQSNYGASVCHLAVREEVFGGFVPNTGNIFLEVWKSKGLWSTHKASEKELEQILAAIEKGLNLGGLGVGTPVGYAVEGVTAYEMNQAWRLAGKHGVFATVHGRFSSLSLPTEGLLGHLEAMANAQMHGSGLLIHHYHGQVLNPSNARIRQPSPGKGAICPAHLARPSGRAVDGPSAGLEVELRGLAVHHAKLHREGIVGAMAMSVDESGRHDLPARIDDGVRDKGGLRDGNDPVGAHSHMPYAVEAGFRVHYPSVGNYQVKFLGFRHWSPRRLMARWIAVVWSRVAPPCAYGIV
jgi:hypothetical protein